MIAHRAARSFVILGLVGAGSFTSAAMAHGVSPAARYASPTGVDSADCPQAAPCGLVTAINAAPSGSEVVVETGTYGSPAAPITAELTDSHGPIDVHGAVGEPMPVIYSGNTAEGNGAAFDSGGTVVSDLDIISTAAAYSFALDNAEADHLIIDSTAAEDAACYLANATIIDSLCRTTVGHGTAIFTSNGTNTVRGVTAIASGLDGRALVASSFDTAVVTESVTNSILMGDGGGDVVAIANHPGSAHITVDHSDFSSSSPLGDTAVVTKGAGDISAAPSFFNAPLGEFQELAGSPTIDKGAAVPASDTTDLAGNARTQGKAPDMGAYEFASPKPKPKKPTARGLKAVSIKVHTVRMTVKVDPNGRTTTVKLVATHGHLQITSSSVSAGHGSTTKTIHLTLRGLSRHTKYKVYALASSTAGRTKSAAKTVLTKRN